MPNCPHPYDLQSFVDGALSGDELASVREHVAGCDACAARVAELERLHWLLRARQVQPPAGLCPRILDLLKTAVPVRKLRCREARAMASAYIDEELNQLERETLEAHLFACEECYYQYVAMRTAATAMRETPPAPASADLKQRILTAVAADAPQPQPVIAHIAPRPAVWRRVLAPAAAIAAIALLTFGIVQMNNHNQPPAPILAAVAPSVAHAPAATRAPTLAESNPPSPLTPETAPATEAEPARPEITPTPEPTTAERAVAERPAALPEPEVPRRATPRDRMRRPLAPVDRPALPRRAVVLEPPALAMRPEPRQPSRLAASGRTLRPPRRPAAFVAAETPMPAPPLPDSLVSVPPTGVTASRPLARQKREGGRETSIASVPPLTRPKPRSPSASPAVKPQELAPKLEDTPATRLASRDWVPKVSESRRTLYSGPRDTRADLAHRSAAINARAAAEREMTETEPWSLHD